jgi:hypothetical protein
MELLNATVITDVPVVAPQTYLTSVVPPLVLSVVVAPAVHVFEWSSVTDEIVIELGWLMVSFIRLPGKVGGTVILNGPVSVSVPVPSATVSFS